MSVAHRRPPVLFQPGYALLPADFPARLGRLKAATGLSWEGLAVCLGVDSRQVLRWRRGTEPCGGAMLALVRLARRVPGGLDDLLAEDHAASHWHRVG